MEENYEYLLFHRTPGCSGQLTPRSICRSREAYHRAWCGSVFSWSISDFHCTCSSQLDFQMKPNTETVPKVLRPESYTIQSVSPSPLWTCPKNLFLKHPFGASHLILKLTFRAIKKAYGQMIWNFWNCRHKKWYCPGFLPSSTIFHFLGPS